MKEKLKENVKAMDVEAHRDLRLLEAVHEDSRVTQRGLTIVQVDGDRALDCPNPDFAPPDLKARLGLGDMGTSPLALVTTHMDRQRLASGNELLTVTGRVINPTGKEQNVPPLQAQLRNKTGKVVYSWTIAPPARSLPAGASASFNSAEVNVPPGGDELTITLGSPRA